MASIDKDTVISSSQEYMRNHGSSESEITVFTNLLNKNFNENAVIDWSSWKHLPESLQCSLSSLKEPSKDEIESILNRVAVIRLNGGLGTTMGCKGPKSFIEVKDGLTFLEIALRQHEEFNNRYNVNIPLLLMNSFHTHKSTVEIVKDRAQCFVQSKCPRLDASTLLPFEEEDESWNPPGHGNIYVALKENGLLSQLLNKGIDIIFVSNIDNTGAELSCSIAKMMVKEGIEYTMECTKKTQIDLKGGTLIDINGSIMHLEMPQVPSENINDFCSTRVFSIFNTNNIWINLSAVKDPYTTTAEIIVNKKRTSSGRNVIQLETSIGGSIKFFKKSICVHVDRSRFIPVKGTSDLLAVSSDLYSLDHSYCLRLFSNPPPPIITLSSHFNTVGQLHSRFPIRPSMKYLKSLRLNGDISFEGEVTFKGDVSLSASSPFIVPNGTVYEDVSIESN